MKYNIAATVLSLLVILTSFTIHHSWVPIASSCVLGLAMIAVAISDAKRFIIPDVISLPMILVGAFTAPFLNHYLNMNNTLFQSAVSAVWGFGLLYLVKLLYWKIRGRDGLGMGDVKLAAVAGAWTGILGLNYVILLSCILALLFLLVLQLSGRKVHQKTVIPFGVFLAPAIWIIWTLQSSFLYLDRWLPPHIFG